MPCSPMRQSRWSRASLGPQSCLRPCLRPHRWTEPRRPSIHACRSRPTRGHRRPRWLRWRLLRLQSRTRRVPEETRRQVKRERICSQTKSCRSAKLPLPSLSPEPAMHELLPSQQPAQSQPCQPCQPLPVPRPLTLGRGSAATTSGRRFLHWSLAQIRSLPYTQKRQRQRLQG